MATRDWARIRSHFDDAVQRAGEERAAYLAHLRSLDPDDAATVRALVAAHERAPDFLEHGLGALLPPPPDDPAPETRIGPYRLERALGEGGMGIVHLATHEDGRFRRQVALKVARREIPTGYLVERFAAERDILARLTHPNIAHLYDGGITADGRPYLAMEYVAGTPITEHCARYALGRRERLALVQVVCRAVDYAHRHLVIHRDLKPSNILVTAEGEVKLLDFGVAKVLEPEGGAERRDPTRTVVALTPAYAAPEQLRRGRVTTATDVYGIGALAYELLAGARPHAVDGLPLAEVARVVCEADPPPPTARAGERPSDVDHVILKALRVEPEERYATPRELAEDLQRVLDGRPVTARTPTLAYRAARFVRRNRGRVLAATAAALALVATTGLALQQARTATALARRAAAERARSDSATARAQRINRFLQNVLATANPAWYVASPEKGPNVTVLRALELAAERMEGELADDPETRADIHHTLGDTYRVLEQNELMARHFEQAMALRARVFRPPHPKLADGLFYLSTARGRLRRYDESYALLLESIAMQRQRDEGNNLPYMLEALAADHAAQGRYGDALAAAAEAVALVRARFGPEHPMVAVMEGQQAVSLAMLGRQAEGWAIARAAAARTRTPSVVRALGWLAVADGDLAAADTLFAEYARAYPYPGVSLVRVAEVLVPQRRWREARVALASTTDSIRAVLPQRPHYLLYLAQAEALAAAVSAGAEELARAEREARRALATIDRGLAGGGARFDPYWQARVQAQGALARVHRAAGRRAEAERLLQDNLRAVERRQLPARAVAAARAALAAVTR